jgi:3-oxoacyl-[acyl-carrier protein] reductase
MQAGKPHPKMASEWVKDPSDVLPLAIFLAAQGQHGPTGQTFSLARRPVV